jgi:hypothetical protein
MITGMGVFIECGYGSNTRIAAATLVMPKYTPSFPGLQTLHQPISHKPKCFGLCVRA